MTTVTTKKSGLYKYDAGKYKAHLTDYEQKMTKDNDEILIWKFDIEKPMLDGKKIEGSDFGSINCVTSLILSNHPKCKMAKMLRAMGFDLDFDGDEFDLDQAIGKSCMLLISDDDSNDDFSKIVDFIKE